MKLASTLTMLALTFITALAQATTESPVALPTADQCENTDPAPSGDNLKCFEEVHQQLIRWNDHQVIELNAHLQARARQRPAVVRRAQQVQAAAEQMVRGARLAKNGYCLMVPNASPTAAMAAFERDNCLIDAETDLSKRLGDFKSAASALVSR